MRQKVKVAVRPVAGDPSGPSPVIQAEVAILGSEILLKQNKPEGYMCVRCSWAKPAKPRPFEFCENGAKATAWRSRTSWSHRYSLPSTHTLDPITSWKSGVPRCWDGRP